MIEVEKKFAVRPGVKERLISGAQLVGRTIMTDIYFDTPDYQLTCKDRWLRKRNERWELKLPLNRERIGDRTTDQYQELENEAEIARALGMSGDAKLAEALVQGGHAPFCTVVTTREKYKSGDFTLDFDETDFGFSLLEIELLVQDPRDVMVATQRIVAFAHEHGTTAALDHGKIIEYLYRKSPPHYAALVSAGVIRVKG